MGRPRGGLRRCRRDPSAPPQLNRSGVGDVLCHHTAHVDWKLARDAGQEDRRWPYDEHSSRTPRAARDGRRRPRRDPRRHGRRHPPADVGAPLGRSRVPRRRLERPPPRRRRPRVPVLPGIPDRPQLHPRTGRGARHLPGPSSRTTSPRSSSAGSIAPAWTSGRGDGHRLGGRWHGDAAARLVRPPRGPAVHDRRCPAGDRRLVDGIRDRITATFGAWPEEGPAAPRGGFV